jgi:hypothetical protein
MAPSALQDLVDQVNLCGEEWSKTQEGSDKWTRTHRPTSYTYQGGLLLNTAVPLTSYAVSALSIETATVPARRFTTDWSAIGGTGVFRQENIVAEAYLQHTMVVTHIDDTQTAGECHGSRIVFRIRGRHGLKEDPVLTRQAEIVFNRYHQPAHLAAAMARRDWDSVHSIVVYTCGLITSSII